MGCPRQDFPSWFALTSLLYIIASVVTTILSDEKVNKQNGDSNVEQDHHDDQDGS